MRKEDGLTPAETEFEAALAGLQPAGTAIDRDALMYRAGVQAGCRHNRPWQIASMLLGAALAASLAAQVLPRDSGQSPQITDSADRVRQALAGISKVDQPAESHYFNLRREILEKGLAALPEPAADKSGRQPPLTLRELLGEPDPTVRTTRQLGIMDRILLGDKL